MNRWWQHGFAIASLFLIFIAAQSFQCVSSEMTTAKLAIKQKEWKKAEAQLLRELQKRPANGEAWYLLARVRYETGNIEGMLEAIKEAKQRVTKPQQRRDLQILLYRSWIEQFNKAAELYNQGIEQQDKATLQQAQEAIERAIALKAENPENYELLGYIKDALGDTLGSIRAFEHYLQRWKKEREFLQQHQLTLGSSRQLVHQQLGQPRQTDTLTGDANRQIEQFIVDGDTVYLFYVHQNGTWKLQGLRVAPPAEWLTQEKQRFTTFNLHPFLLLADYYHRHQQSDKALAVIQEALAIGGTDENLLRLQAGILQQVGKQQEAVRALENLIERFPDNATYRVVLASTLAQLGQTDKAIEQFEKALSIDPNADVALFNLGAIYKNRASEIQQEEKRLIEEGKKKSEDTARYFPLLRKAASYFERYRQIPGKSSDFVTLRELLNIYQVLQNKRRYAELVAELKALEPLNKTNPAYYELLGSILTRENKIEEAKKAFEKADQLRGKKP